MSIVLTNEYLGLAQGPIEHQSSSIINAICGDSSLKIGDVVGLLPFGAPFKKELTVLAADVTGASPLTAFPLLVSITDTDLRDNARSDGFDIFFTNSDGTTIPYDRESYDNTTGTLVAWVLTDLSDTVDNTFFMFYGNSNSSDQQNPLPVWNTRFEDVFHFNQTSPLPWLNSSVGKNFTLNLINSNNPSPVQGQIGNASNSSVSEPNTNTIFFQMAKTVNVTPSEFFVSAWIKHDNLAQSGFTIYDSWSSEPIGEFTGNSFLIIGGDNNLSTDLILYVEDGTGIEITIGDIGDLIFHHVSIRYSNNTFDVFFDGSFVSATAYVFVSLPVFNDTSSGDGIAVNPDNVVGRIDQLQVAYTANFSNGFITTSFDNQKDSGQGAGNFVKVGPQQSVSNFTPSDELLPRVGVVGLGEQSYGIVVGGDFEGVYSDGVISLDSNNLAKGIIASFLGEGVKVCTQGRCLALASGSISIGDKLTASSVGLVNAEGGNIIATALQAASEINSIIAVDVQREGFVPGGGFVYYVAAVGGTNRSVIRSNFEGTNQVELPLSGILSGIAVDSTSIYVTDLGLRVVIKSDLDGTNQTILPINLTGVSLAIDVDSNFIYVVDASINIVIKADLDGTNQVTLPITLIDENGIAVDSTSIYLTDSDLDIVIKTDLDGTNQVTLPITGLMSANEIDVDSTSIYVSDNILDAVIKADLDGTNEVTLPIIVSGMSNPGGIGVSSTSYYVGNLSNEATKILKADLDGTNQIMFPVPDNVEGVLGVYVIEITK